MINNDFLKGYIQGLNNISEAIEAFKKDKWDEEVILGFQLIQDYIDQTKENYKQLVKELNAKEEKAKGK